MFFPNSYRDYEKNNLTEVFDVLPRNAKILDVGCGFGRQIEVLNDMGFNNIQGIDINPSNIEVCEAKGLQAQTVDAFEKTDQQYDVILMSHVIEHVSALDFLDFMETYLARLCERGHLVISTPLLASSFYTNYDHQKPYNVESILNAFAPNQKQIQRQSPVTLKLIDIRFRRAPFTIRHHRSRYTSSGSRSISYLNTLFLVLYKITGGLIGFSDAWIGMFEKTGQPRKSS